MAYRPGYDCRNYAGLGFGEAGTSSDGANALFSIETPGGEVDAELVAANRP